MEALTLYVGKVVIVAENAAGANVRRRDSMSIYTVVTVIVVLIFFWAASQESAIGNLINAKADEIRARAELIRKKVSESNSKSHLLSHKLRTLRTNKGLSVFELSQAIGVSVGTIMRWESGDTMPAWTKIVELAEFFGVTPDEIVKR